METHTSNMRDTHLGNIKTHPLLCVLKPYSSERGLHQTQAVLKYKSPYFL